MCLESSSELLHLLPIASLHLQQQARDRLIVPSSTLSQLPTTGTTTTKSIYPLNNTANMDVPTKTSLADIYPEDALQAQTTRWNSLLSTFKDTYGKSADFVSRSPGRVNIIGEVSSGVTVLE
jgi:hypothetical protein